MSELSKPPHFDASVVSILKATVIAHFGSCGGSKPHVTPVWVRWVGDGCLEVNVAATTKKARNIRSNRQVCLSMVAPHDARLWIVIEALVEETRRTEDRTHLDELARRYLGRPRRNPEMPREVLTLRPTAVHWWGEETT